MARYIWEDLNLWDSQRMVLVTEDMQEVLQVLVSNMKTGVGLFELKERECRALYLNQAFFERIGIVKTNFPDIPNCIMECVQAGKVLEQTICIKKRDKSESWFAVKTAPITDPKTEGRVVLLIMRDITDKRENELKMKELEKMNEELLMREARYRVLAETVQGILFEYFPTRDTMVFSYNLPHNRKTREITGYSSYVKKNPIVHSDHIAAFAQTLQGAVMAEKEGSLEYLSAISGGGYRWHRAYYKSVVGADGKVASVMGRITDIHAEVLEREKRNYQAQIDPMTGLYRKEIVFEKMEELVNEAPSADFYFTLIDLDDFKAINDQHGHQYGNKILKEAADAILGIYAEDSVVGCYGGDEFVALSKDVSEQEVKRKAETLLDKVPCSIGIVPWMKGRDVSDMFDWAEDNMYEAKRAGKGAVCYQVVPLRKTEKAEK
ncbi:MAG: GGDEF domain-containing protein [Lachnospiraceae bacterium]|nr:GGDEF domain-containing protein [Lachnospiraceae bacterium]